VVSCRFAPLCPSTFPLSKRMEHEMLSLSCECTQVKAQLEISRQAEYQLEMVVCEACSEEVRRRDLTRHSRLACPHRDVSCTLGCGDQVPAHRLAYHLRFDCVRALEKAFLVQRARLRSGYPRPWALEIEFPTSPSSNSNDVVSSDVESVPRSISPIVVITLPEEGGSVNRRPPANELNLAARDRVRDQMAEGFDDSDVE
jgi:hypothetical protein